MTKQRDKRQNILYELILAPSTKVVVTHSNKNTFPLLFVGVASPLPSPFSSGIHICQYVQLQDSMVLQFFVNLKTQFMLYFCFPGLFFILPCIDSYQKVDLRTVSFDVPPQEVCKL